MKKAIRGRGCLLASGTLLAAMPVYAYAEVPAPAAKTAADASTAADDIVVTAQRRSTSLSRTPVAVAVLSEERLAQAAVATESDLQVQVPGLLVRQEGNSNQLNYAIRGQSLDPYSNGRPGVLPYFNEVQISGSGASGFYDLQSIQVLKGPQGTLFGRNATGGAVLFQSVKPTNEFGGYVSAALGDWNARKFEGALNLPIVKDKVLLRVAGFDNQRDGFQYDLFDGKRRGDVDRYGFRGSLTIQPTDWLKNELVVDYAHSGGSSTAAVLYDIDQAGLFPATSLYTNALLPSGSGPLTGTSLSDFVLSRVLQSQGLPATTATALSTGNYARYIASHPGVDPAGLVDFLAQQKARGPYRISVDTPNTYRASNIIITDTLTADLGPDTQFRTIIGYTRIRPHFQTDPDGTSYNLLQAPTVATPINQFSIEPQIVGKALSRRLSYVVGVYYSDEKTGYQQTATSFDIILGGSTKVINDFSYNRTIAVYGQGTFDLSSVGVEGLSAIAGLRYTHERVRDTKLPGDDTYVLATVGLPRVVPPIPASAFNNDQSKTIQNVSYTLGLQEQFTRQLMIYANTRRSFKNGGYNSSVQPLVGDASIGGNSYNTETLYDVELGTKFNGLVGGLPATANIALYYDWINNNQRTAFASVNGSISALTVNVPKASVYGAELDGQIQPSSWLTIGGSANYTHARFQASSGNNVVIIQRVPIAYLYVTDTPEWSGAVFAEVKVPVKNNIAVVVHGDVFRQTHTDIDPTRSLQLPGYTLANFRVALTDNVKGWSLTANLKNAFNRTYYVGGLPLGPLVQISSALPGDRRTFLVEARYKF